MDETLDKFDQLTQAVLRVSKTWMLTIAVAATLSCVHLTFDHQRRLSGSFEISAVTVALLALIWLPAAIRILGVAGGGVKTPAGEASTPGLLDVFMALDPVTKRNAIPPVLTALSSAEVLVDIGRSQESDALRKGLELQLASVVPLTGGVRHTLDLYAAEYEKVRRSLPPGRARTMRMTTITAEARAIARATPLSAADLQHLMSNGSDGERVIALALMQDSPDAQLLDSISDGILRSRSAFEQYQALAAAFKTVPSLNRGQQLRLRVVLTEALADPQRAIRNDSSRALLVDTMFAHLDA